MPALESLNFLRHKYGRELLIDAFELRNDVRYASPLAYRLRYYDLVFIDHAAGEVVIDDRRIGLHPQQVLLTASGRVRTWRLTEPMTGVVILFPGEFLQEAAQDPLFLHRLSLYDRGNESLELNHDSFAAVRNAAREIALEVANLREDSAHLMQACLMRLLITLNRSSDGCAAVTDSIFISFREMLEQRYATLQRVSEYARELGVTPRRLNDLCIQQVGVNAAEIIRGRLFLEAKRRLAFSNDRVVDISASLGFTDSAYFNRFFRRYANVTPVAYRQQNR